MNPMVSVLLLTHNHEKYIAQAIESALEQTTNFDYEILIGDDCSTDLTSKIVAEYFEKYPSKIKLITSKKSLEPLQNEKRVIEASSGKYLCFLEGDDYWANKNKLQKQVDFLETHLDYGLVHSDVNHYYENTDKLELAVNKTRGVLVPSGDIFECLIRPEPLFIKTATTCFRKELVIKYFDYDLAIKENWPLTDWPLWADISYHSKVHYFDEVFATYRLLNESASRTKSKRKHYKFVKDLHKIKILYLKKYMVDDSKVELVKENYYRSLLKYSIKVNDIKDFQEAFIYFQANKLKLSIKEKLLFLTAYLKLNKIISFLYK